MRFQAALGCVVTIGLMGCASSNGDPIGNGNGVAGAGGLAGGGVGGSIIANGGSSVAGAAGAAVEACPETRTPIRSTGTVVELGFAPTLAGKPFVVGEPNAVAGGQISPLNLRFYVSELSLTAADGSQLPVDLVSAAGQPEPYGVHLVNFEEPASTSIHVLAPAGDYTGARFTFGISDACNSGDANRDAPLSANSQMVWPHVAGSLFLRYEAQWQADATAAATAATPPSMIHMGGVVGSVFAPQATLTGALAVPATGSVTRTIQVSFDEIFRGASSSDDVSNVPIPTPEVIAGERLRRAVPTLTIFTLAAP
jgi:hypothetical protein